MDSGNVKIRLLKWEIVIKFIGW